MAAIRYPIDIVEHLFIARYPAETDVEAAGVANAGASVSSRRIGHHFGYSAQQWRHHRVKGVTRFDADRIAVRLGYHPAVVWPQWMTDSINDLPEHDTNQKDAA